MRQGDTLNGFVDAGCIIRGELEFENTFRLDGRIEGAVKSSAEFLVGEGGVVEGEVEVARCLVGGTVRGAIRASQQVVLHATARVWAEVHTPALVMEEGAFLEGKVNMEKRDRSSTSTPKKETS
ncbi:MAG: polymer-forming cytoskeletal protein [bacterium]|nr:polymer-forming cytoskeletal protein [bacterium]